MPIHVIALLARLAFSLIPALPCYGIACPVLSAGHSGHHGAGQSIDQIMSGDNQRLNSLMVDAYSVANHGE